MIAAGPYLLFEFYPWGRIIDILHGGRYFHIRRTGYMYMQELEKVMGQRIELSLRCAVTVIKN